MLEVAVCAQHNNGGLLTDAWWQTNIEGFFCAGERLRQLMGSTAQGAVP